MGVYSQTQAVGASPSPLSGGNAPPPVAATGPVVQPPPGQGPPAPTQPRAAPVYQANVDPNMAGSDQQPSVQPLAAPDYSQPAMPSSVTSSFIPEAMTNPSARETFAPEIAQDEEQNRSMAQSSFRNAGLAMRGQRLQDEEKAAQDRQNAANAKIQFQQDQSAKEQDFISKGIAYKKMPDGTVAANTDDKGNPVYKPLGAKDAPIEYDQNGKAVQNLRDSSGNITPTDPDAKSPLVPWTDDNGQPWVVKQNKYNDYQYTKPEDAINSADPAMQINGAKILHGQSLANTTQGIADINQTLDAKGYETKLTPKQTADNAERMTELQGSTAQPPAPKPASFFGFGPSSASPDPDAMKNYNNDVAELKGLTEQKQLLDSRSALAQQQASLTKLGPAGFLQEYKKKNLAGTTDNGDQPQPMGAPQDFAQKFNTPLPSNQVQAFNQWKAKYAPNDDGSDYDLQGAFLAGVKPDADRGHFPDTFKKPNHPTFSDQSQYNGSPDGQGGTYQGGKWGDDNSFTPGATNLQSHSSDELNSYFKSVEPNSKLNLPPTSDQNTDSSNSLAGLVSGTYGQKPVPADSSLYGHTVRAFNDALKSQGVDDDINAASDPNQLIGKLNKIVSDKQQPDNSWLSAPAHLVGGLLGQLPTVGKFALGGAGVGAGVGAAFGGVGALPGAVAGGGLGVRFGFGVAGAQSAHAQALIDTYSRLKNQGLSDQDSLTKALEVAKNSIVPSFVANAAIPGFKGIGSSVVSKTVTGATAEAGTFAASNVASTAATQQSQVNAGVKFKDGERSDQLVEAATSGMATALGMRGAHEAINLADHEIAVRKVLAQVNQMKGPGDPPVTRDDIQKSFDRQKLTQQVAVAQQQFAKIDKDASLSPEDRTTQKAKVMAALPANLRPVVQRHFDNDAEAQNQAQAASAFVSKDIPAGNPALAPNKFTDAELQGELAGTNPKGAHPKDPNMKYGQFAPADIQAEVDRRNAQEAASIKLGPVLEGIKTHQENERRRIDQAGTTPDGLALLDGINRHNAALPRDMPKADLSTAQLASDVSPKTDADQNVQPHTLGYLPVAHDVESIQNPHDRDFATSALKVLNGRSIDPNAESELVGGQGGKGAPPSLPKHIGKSGLPLATRDPASKKIVLTDEGLNRLRQLVPSSRPMLTQDGMPITSQHLREAGGKLNEKAQPAADKKLAAKSKTSAANGKPVARIQHLASIEDGMLKSRLSNLQAGRERLRKADDVAKRRGIGMPAAHGALLAAHERNIAEHEQEIEARKQQRTPPEPSKASTQPETSKLTPEDSKTNLEANKKSPAKAGTSEDDGDTVKYHHPDGTIHTGEVVHAGQDHYVINDPALGQEVRVPFTHVIPKESNAEKSETAPKTESSSNDGKPAAKFPAGEGVESKSEAKPEPVQKGGETPAVDQSKGIDLPGIADDLSHIPAEHHEVAKMVSDAFVKLKAALATLGVTKFEAVEIDPKDSLGMQINTDDPTKIQIDLKTLTENLARIPAKERAIRIEKALDEEMEHVLGEKVAGDDNGTHLNEKATATFKAIWDKASPHQRETVTDLYEKQHRLLTLGAEGTGGLEGQSEANKGREYFRMLRQLHKDGNTTELTRLLSNPNAKSFLEQMVDYLKRVLTSHNPALKKLLADAESMLKVASKKNSTQINLPDSVAKAVKEMGKSIPESEIYTEPDKEYGREDQPHVTVHYGLEAEPKAVQKLVKDFGNVTLKLGKTSIFEGEKYDVLKVGVEGDDIHRLNALLKKEYPVDSKFPNYQPHITIAYMKKGEAAKYAGDDRFDGLTVPISRFVFSDKERNHVPISLSADEGHQPLTDAEIKAQEKSRKDMLDNRKMSVETLISAVHKVGGLNPTDPVLQGELKNIKEAANKGHILRLLRRDGKPLDQLREALAERGFNFDTVTGMLEAIQRTLSTGQDHFASGISALGAAPILDGHEEIPGVHSTYERDDLTGQATRLGARQENARGTDLEASAKSGSSSNPRTEGAIPETVGQGKRSPQTSRGAYGRSQTNAQSPGSSPSEISRVGSEIDARPPLHSDLASGPGGTASNYLENKRVPAPNGSTRSRLGRQLKADPIVSHLDRKSILREINQKLFVANDRNLAGGNRMVYRDRADAIARHYAELHGIPHGEVARHLAQSIGAGKSGDGEFNRGSEGSVIASPSRGDAYKLFHPGAAGNGLVLRNMRSNDHGELSINHEDGQDRDALAKRIDDAAQIPGHVPLEPHGETDRGHAVVKMPYLPKAGTMSDVNRWVEDNPVAKVYDSTAHVLGINANDNYIAIGNDGKPYLVSDINPKNFRQDANGKPWLIDAIPHELTPQDIDEHPAIKNAVVEARGKKTVGAAPLPESRGAFNQDKFGDQMDKDRAAYVQRTKAELEPLEASKQITSEQQTKLDQARNIEKSMALRAGKSVMAATVTKTPEFKNWFGDWENDPSNASKVVNEDGSPKTVYHGTAQSFSSFDPASKGSLTGAYSAKKGYFFTGDPKVAANYSSIGYRNDAHTSLYTGKELTLDEIKQLEAETDKRGSNIYKSPFSSKEQTFPINRVSMHEQARAVRKAMENGDSFSTAMGKHASQEFAYAVEGDMDYHDAGQGSNLMPSYLSLKNPLIHDFHGSEYRDTTYSKLLRQAQEKGHDGAIFKNTFDDPGGDYSPEPEVNPNVENYARQMAEQEGNEWNHLIESQKSTYYDDAHSSLGIPNPEPPQISHDIYVAFEPAQIKSAIGNSGKFDPKESSVLGASRPLDRDTPDMFSDGVKDTVASDPIKFPSKEAALKSYNAIKKIQAEGKELKPVQSQAMEAAERILGQEFIDMPDDHSLEAQGIKRPAKLYRGTMDSGKGAGTASFGKGLYSSTDGKWLRNSFKFDNVVEIDPRTSYPSFPLKFDGVNPEGQFTDWLLAQSGQKNMRDFNKMHPDLAAFVKSHGYDGAVVGREIVKYANGSDGEVGKMPMPKVNFGKPETGIKHVLKTESPDMFGEKKPGQQSLFAAPVSMDDLDKEIQSNRAKRSDQVRDIRSQLDARTPDQINKGQFGNDLDARYAAQPMLADAGFSSSKWGSQYAEGEYPDGTKYKLSIRDHDSSPAYQKADKSFRVSKDWTPEEVDQAISKAEDYLKSQWPLHHAENNPDHPDYVSPYWAKKLAEEKGKVVSAAEPLPGSIAAKATPEAKEVSDKMVGLARAGLRKLPTDVHNMTSNLALAHDDILKWWVPQARSPEAAFAGRSLSAALAKYDNLMNQADAAIAEARDYLNTKSPEFVHQVIDDIEHNRMNSDPRAEAACQLFRATNNKFRDMVRSMPNSHFKNFIENYFPHIWAKEEVPEVQRWIQRKIEGSRAFLKNRTIPTVAEGLAAGFHLVSDNPADLFMIRWGQMSKYMAGQEMLKDLKDAGIAKPYDLKDIIPAGMKQIDDRLGLSTAEVPVTPNETAEDQIPGLERPIKTKTVNQHYYAPESVVQLLDNHLSPGLQDYGIYKILTGVANTMNQFQLGFSAFHLGFTTLDMGVSKLAYGLEESLHGLRHGDAESIKQGITAIGSVPKQLASPLHLLAGYLNPKWDTHIGSLVSKEMDMPGSQGPEIAAIAHLVVQGGGGNKMDPAYANQMVKSFKREWLQGNKFGYAWRAPLAAVEMASRPIMEYIVPRQKIAVMADLARMEMRKLGPDAKQDDVRNAMQKAWASVDNRMGQLRYDNLYWNKTAKDLSHIVVRSVGWNLGSYRELLGGLKDWGTGAVKVAQGKTNEAEFTHRMAYTLALPMLVGSIGAMINYLYTGQAPQEMRDYFFPKTGEKDGQGHNIRLALPSYMKDVYGFAHQPGQTFVNKASPMWSMMGDLYNNKDFFNTEIRHPGDNYVEQAAQLLGYVGKSFAPFALTGAARLNQQGASPAKMALPFFGVTPAASWIDKSPAELKAEEINDQNMPAGAKTQAETDKSQAKSLLMQQLHANDPLNGGSSAKFGALLHQATTSGVIQRKDVDQIVKRSRMTPLEREFHYIPYAKSVDVWNLASREEKEKLLPMFREKMERAKSEGQDVDQSLLKLSN